MLTQDQGNIEIIFDIIETYLSRGGIGGWSKRVPPSARLSLGGGKDGQFDFFSNYIGNKIGLKYLHFWRDFTLGMF